MITKEQIKNTGATFTPRDLAIFLAERLMPYVQSGNKRVLDPACGEGELLLAMADVLLDSTIDFSLTGYDANEQYLKDAKERLWHSGAKKLELNHKNFLESVDIRNIYAPSLFQELKSVVNNSFDIVIANPPYVRTQILGQEQAQALARKFDLKGRVDLYYPFLVAMTESLKEGGILGVITSNRYLSTKSGESVRKFLSKNYEILELIDLGDTKLFDAAVLPAIFIGRKGKSRTNAVATFMKLYEEFNAYNNDFITSESIYSILKDRQSGYFNVNGKKYKKSTGLLKYETGSGDCWELLSGDESNWVSQIDKARHKLEDFFKVKVGIKSTADNIFISDKWDILDEGKPEDELLKELISQENIKPWNLTENIKLKVLYPYLVINGEKQIIDLDKYPKAKMYFIQHEEKLKSRKYLIDAGRKWFELWVPHRPDQWKYPKLVFPDISLQPRFYFDNEGKIVNGNCYWIVATKQEDIDKLLLIQGIANSKLMTKYHDLVFNNKLYSGRRRYISQYVEKYPLPDFSSPRSKEIVAIVRELNQCDDIDKISKLESHLEFIVAASYGVEPVLTLD
jgi:adenine-specific DNA-methyltransferase